MEAGDFVIQPGTGFLIVYEGISGSGKSEGIQRLKQELDAIGMTADVTEWNSNARIRRLTGRLSRIGWLTPGLYSLLQWISFWIDYRTFIAPRLRAGGMVIADRYVYTGMTRDAANGAGSKWGRWWLTVTRRPDLVFFYDTPPLTCCHRIQSRGKSLFIPGRANNRGRPIPDRELDYLKRIREEYVRLFASKRVIPGTNVVWIKDGTPDACDIVKDYWFAKSGAEDAWMYRRDNRTGGM